MYTDNAGKVPSRPGLFRLRVGLGEGIGGRLFLPLPPPATPYHRSLSLSLLPSALTPPSPCNTILSLCLSAALCASPPSSLQQNTIVRPLSLLPRAATMGTEVLQSHYELRSPGSGTSSGGPGYHTTRRFPPRLQGGFSRHREPSSGGGCKNDIGGSNHRPGRRGRRIDEPQGPMVVKVPVRNLVMEEVIILKRGQELKLEKLREKTDTSDGDNDVPQLVRQHCSTDGVLLLLSKQQQVRRRVEQERPPEPYSGPSFLTTPPSPTCLPFPSSLLPKKKEGITIDTT